MPELVYRRHGGLLVAEDAADFQAVERALKAFDADLVLNVERRNDGRPVYDVHKVIASDRPAVFICRWQDERGEPLPLSSALVDLVKELHPSSRAARGDLSTDQLVDRRNAALREEARRETREGAAEVLGDLLPRLKGKRIPVLHRGRHLLRSRHKPGGRWS